MPSLCSVYTIMIEYMQSLEHLVISKQLSSGLVLNI